MYQSNVMNNSSCDLTFRKSEPLISLLKRPSVALSLLAVFVFAIYYGTLSFEFVWDDVPQIVNNPLIRDWSLSRVFFNDLWFHASRDQVYYRPLFVVWLILNFKIFGLKAWGWHLGSVLLHILASCTVFCLARVLKLEYPTALLAAILFGLHPMHIECAAWISAGSDSMVTIFFVLAFSAFLKSHEPKTHRRRFLIASYLLFICALLVKEMAVTFSVMVLIYECVMSRDVANQIVRVRRATIAAAPYIALTIGYLLLRRLAVHRTWQFDPYYSNLNAALTIPVVLFSYLRLLTFPKGLTGLYFIPYVTNPGFWNFVFPSFTLIAALAVLWYWARHKQDPRIYFAALWLIVGLLPILYLRAFPPGGAVRDRYAYLPSVGFALLLAQAIRLLKMVGEPRRSFLLQAVVAATICVAFVTGVLLQQVYWGNNFLLFYRGYSLYPQNIYAGVELGSALIKKNEFGRAIALLTAITRDRTENGAAYYYLATAYLRTGEIPKARKALDSGLQFDPQVMQSSTEKSDVANLFAQLGDYQTALTLYSQVLEKEPNLYSALYNSGYAYFLLNEDAQSEERLLHAMQVAPDYAAPVYYLGRIYLRGGKPALAETYFRKAIAIDPKGYDFHYWLGATMAERGLSSQALDEYAEELKLYPKNPNALVKLNRTESNQPNRANQ